MELAKRNLKKEVLINIKSLIELRKKYSINDVESVREDTETKIKALKK